jgi:hypothetical protein
MLIAKQSLLMHFTYSIVNTTRFASDLGTGDSVWRWMSNNPSFDVWVVYL